MKRHKNYKVSLVLIAMITMTLVTLASGKIIYVDDDAAGTNDGSGWENAYVYLQDALRDANESEKPVEIRVAQGVYKPDGGIMAIPEFDWRTLSFQLINGVTLKGGYAGLNESDPNARDIELYETILSGDLNGDDVEVADPCDLADEPNRAENSYHVVTSYHNDETAVLDGFIISGGNANGDDWLFSQDGGGMYNNFSGSPTVKNCTFSGNSAVTSGGGMCNFSNSSPKITNCTFIVNSAGYIGGGMCNNLMSHTILTNCTFSDNAADHGSGMCNYMDASPTITNCTFSDNHGMGLYNYIDTSPVLNNCIFSGNSGRGMINIGNELGDLVLTNCIFSGNRDGGMYNRDSSLIITDCFFVDNHTEQSGGGIYNENSDLTLTNCIFSDNTAKNGNGMYNNSSGIVLNNCIFSRNSAEYGNALVCDSYLQLHPSNVELTNCILWNGGNEIWNNDGSTLGITYSNVQSGRAGMHDPCEAVIWGAGNIDVDPLFADSESGDYHLKSQTGRYDPNNGSWVKDDVTSPCIDAGDPNSSWTGEIWPHGERINMGAYGGTFEASMSMQTNGMSLPRVAFIYKYYAAMVDSFKSLLETYGVAVTAFSVFNYEQVSLADYDLIIVADNVVGAEALEDGRFISDVEDSGKPVIGLGDGGYDFFGELGLSIGNPYGGHGSRNGIRVIEPEYSLFSTPYPIEIPDDGILQLYTETDSVAIYLWPQVPETITVFGSEPDDTGYFPLLMEHNRYLLWGFDESPQNMTEIGKRLFINVVIWTANAGWES